MTTREQAPTLLEMPSPRVPRPSDLGPEIIYPESDGKPMADNTKQFTYIVKIHTGLATRFHDDPDVFVAADLLWYPVEGDNKTVIAPDVMVAFGRPRGDRGSYLQWREEGIAPHVVFEIVSPSNTWVEMARKQRFYERFGVEEYYVYDPDRGALLGWLGHDGDLEPIEEMEGWISPRLDVSFHLTPEGELELYYPDGRHFESAVEANLRAEAEHQRAEAEHQRAERLAAKLRELGIDPDA